MSQLITVNTDGASRGNPGPAAIAYLLKTGSQAPVEFKQAIGITTNNQAEYQAMVAALEKLTTLDLRDATIEIFSDSELIVHQLNGRYRVKDPHLKPLYSRARGMLDTLEALNIVNVSAVRREQNQQADKLANQALDSKQ